MQPNVGRSLETGSVLAALVIVLALTGLGLSPTATSVAAPLRALQASFSFALYVAHMAAAALLVAFTLWHLLPFAHAFSRKRGVSATILVASHALLALVVVEVLTGLGLYFHVYVPLGKREMVLVHLATTFVIIVPLAIHASRGIRVLLARRRARDTALLAAVESGRGAEARAVQDAVSRRAFLRLGAYALAGAALAFAFARATANQVKAWRLNSVGATPQLDAETYRLRITGEVARPIELTLAQLRALPAKRVRIVHRCVEGWTYTDTFTGVPLPDVLALAGGVKPSAKQLLLKSPEVSRQMHSYGRKYDVNLPIRDAANKEILVVYEVAGEDLPAEHGYPVRTLSNVKWGYKACKWLTEIEVTADGARLGYWERVGYHHEGDYPGPIFA